jgi:hypothetical protein
MLRRIVILFCVGLFAVANADTSEKLEKIQKSLDGIMSKAGISIGGEFKSQAFRSTLDGPGAQMDSASSRRFKEPNEYTSVDFDIKARPNEMVTARVLFRMHQNWQNFFSDVSNPIFTRWLSIDGNVKDMFTFNAGNFKQKFSPLTLYAPEIEIMYEPTIFNRQRKLAMDENFVGENNRNLMGVNLAFDAEIAPIFNEFHAAIIGSRLRSRETSIKNGNYVVTSIEGGNNRLAKYFAGGNIEATFLKGITLGFSELYIFDSKYNAPFDYTDSTADTLVGKTNVLSARPKIDIGKMIGNEALTLNISGELAISNSDSTRLVSDPDNPGRKLHTKSKVNGSGSILGGEVGYQIGNAFGFKINGNFIMNSQHFRNELAQSPTFIGSRIMNIENGGFTKHYTTFDAMYNNVFKFAPAEPAPNGIDWVKGPFQKNNYYRTIFTQSELQKLQDSTLVNRPLLDPALQLVFPFGIATANRVGIKTDFTANVLNGGIEIKALFTSLNEAAGQKRNEQSVYPKAKFSQTGAGLQIDLSKMIPVFKYPLTLSGSFVASTKTRAEMDSMPKNDVTSNFLNAGFYWQFYKRMAVLAGYQIINNTYSSKEDIKVDMGNMAVGVEWKLSDGADVVASLGKITLNSDVKVGNVRDEIEQGVADISLRVKF